MKKFIIDVKKKLTGSQAVKSILPMLEKRQENLKQVDYSTVSQSKNGKKLSIGLDLEKLGLTTVDGVYNSHIYCSENSGRVHYGGQTALKTNIEIGGQTLPLELDVKVRVQANDLIEWSNAIQGDVLEYVDQSVDNKDVELRLLAELMANGVELPTDLLEKLVIKEDKKEPKKEDKKEVKKESKKEVKKAEKSEEYATKEEFNELKTMMATMLAKLG